MRFLDANPFIYAYYKPKGRLPQKERRMKEEAKKIIEEISKGEEGVLTTVVHLSEAVNILKHAMSLDKLIDFVLGLFMSDNVKVQGVSERDYFSALELGGNLGLDPNDALAVDIMGSNNIKEIYSFDEDFDDIECISRLPKSFK